MKNYLIRFSFIILAAAGFSLPTHAHAHESQNSIVEVAQASGQFNTLLAALDAAGLTDILNSPGIFTVFAPTDEAFSKIPNQVLQNLLKPENKEALQEILLYHVLSGEILAEQALEAALKETPVKTLTGENVVPNFMGAQLKVNQSKVIGTDIMASNGVIHVIDQVLLPKNQRLDIVDTALMNGSFTTLIQAVRAAGFEKALRSERPLVLFAPTNAAFAALPKGTLKSLLKPENLHQLRDLLRFHVAKTRFNVFSNLLTAVTLQNSAGENIVVANKDGKIFVEDVEIIIKDIKAKNGTIQVIDTVLTP